MLFALKTNVYIPVIIAKRFSMTCPRDLKMCSSLTLIKRIVLLTE